MYGRYRDRNDQNLNRERSNIENFRCEKQTSWSGGSQQMVKWLIDFFKKRGIIKTSRNQFLKGLQA